MARIMVIAGGAFQCPIVRTAKRMGHYVICSNLFEDSPAFAYSDVGLVANVLDKEKNLAFAREYQPDAVLTDQTDIAVPTVAYIAEQMNLRSIGVDVARRFTNKYLMREYTNRAGFASPRYRLCHCVEEAEAFLSEVPTAIIKPIDSQSSRGIHIVRTKEQIREYYDDCIQYSNAEKAILIEEYIDGTEFTVDGLKTFDDYRVTAISQKEHFAYNANIASRLVFSQDNSDYDYDKLREVNTKMVEAMELPFGLTHAEYKYRDGEFYLIEIAARGGGTMISSDIVPLMSGIESNEVLINMLTDGTDSVEPGPHHSNAVLGFFDMAPGIVRDIRGLDEARALLGVRMINLELEIGQRVGQALDDRSRCGYYIVYADSAEELAERERLLKDTVVVEIDKE